MGTEFLVRKLYILTVIKFRTAADGVCETITNSCGVKDIKLPETYNFDVLGEGPSSESYTIAFKCLHSKRRSSAVYTFQVVVYRHTTCKQEQLTPYLTAKLYVTSVLSKNLPGLNFLWHNNMAI
jgi:hypothetical protein